MIPAHVEAAFALIRDRWPYRAINPAVTETWRRVLEAEPDPKIAREAYETFALDREFVPDPAEFKALCLAIRKRRTLEAVPEPPADAVPMPANFRSHLIRGGSR